MAQQQLNDGEDGLSFRSKLNDMFRQLFGFTQSIQQLADGTTINTDCTQFAKAKVILQGNRTLANPTNMQIGVEYFWYIVQDNVGSRLLTAYGSMFSIIGGAPVLSTAPNAVDCIRGVYDGIKIRAVFQKGFP